MPLAKFKFLLVILLNLSLNTVDIHSVKNQIMLIDENSRRIESTHYRDVSELSPTSVDLPGNRRRLEDLENKINLLKEDLTNLRHQCSQFRQVVDKSSNNLRSLVRQIKHSDRANVNSGSIGYNTFAQRSFSGSGGGPIGPATLVDRRRLSKRALSNEPAQSLARGLDGVPGLDGAPGLDGVPGLDGRNGKDGKDGHDGRDGKDGAPGERGPPGLPGPPGEAGKRGKMGPPGKAGAAGPAGVCAYRAKFDCTLLANITSSASGDTSAALLMAPSMIGGSSGRSSGSITSDDQFDATGQPGADEERQVTVTEGDNIQLSCEAFGLPRPQYLWQRATNPMTPIVLDLESDFRVSSYPGSQLPLVNVDRVQAGSYECLASNGVPPAASKRVLLNVNYKPTIRIYPAPSVYRVQYNSSILVECIVEANPSSFTYWTFGNTQLMTLQTATTTTHSTTQDQQQQQQQPFGRQLVEKYIITESAGELTTGASYFILTLNITNIQPTDLGLYKCISKNLIGQSEGYFWLESSLEDDSTSASSTSSSHLVTTSNQQQQQDLSYRELILEQSWKQRNEQQQRLLERTIGWPIYLLERGDLNYSTFGGNERRRSFRKSSTSTISGSPTVPLQMKRPQVVPSLYGEKLVTTTTGNVSPDFQAPDLDNVSVVATTIPTTSLNSASSNNTMSSNNNNNFWSRATFQDSGDSSADNKQSDDLTADEIELCRSEELVVGGQSRKSSSSSSMSNTKQPAINRAQRASFMLLDQVGKPVYLGSVTSLNWWSVDSFQADGQQEQQVYYATSMYEPDKLFRYSALADLLEDSHHQQLNDESHHRVATTTHKLKHLMFGDSRVIRDNKFIYMSLIEAENAKLETLESLRLVFLDLKTDKYEYLALDSNAIPIGLARQPLNLPTADYKLSRVEIASDENGLWMIIPSIEQRIIASSSALPSRSHLLSSDMLQEQQLVAQDLLQATRRARSFETQSTFRVTERRLHVVKVNYLPISKNELVSSDSIIEIDYHVSMKLDWRMIGQMFIIDGVLYGIKDRHLYSSKLQFAYDLYKCKLLSTEYLTEPHRTFTNHFGNTQMIKYNPNEPKRLYTIDSGNLLWCPVKLIKTISDDIWH